MNTLKSIFAVLNFPSTLLGYALTAAEFSATLTKVIATTAAVLDWVLPGPMASVCVLAVLCVFRGAKLLRAVERAAFDLFDCV